MGGWREELEVIEQVARAAGKVALRFFHGRDALDVERKGALDLVSQADRVVETYLRDALRQRFPHDAFLGEEGGGPDVAAAGRAWVVDPIDGTLNFLRGGDAWAVSVALLEGGVPRLGVVHAPARGETVAGAEAIGARCNGVALARACEAAPQDGVVAIGFGAAVPAAQQSALIRHLVADCGMAFRRNGSSSVSLAMLARGEVDGFVAHGVSLWDVAGGVAVARALGHACDVDWAATRWDRKLSLACAPAPLLARLAAWRAPRSEDQGGG